LFEKTDRRKVVRQDWSLNMEEERRIGYVVDRKT